MLSVCVEPTARLVKCRELQNLKKFGAARVSTHNNSGRKSFASRSTNMVRMAATQGATFAPFSDSRPYELKSRFELPKLPMVPRTMPSPPRPSSRLAARSSSPRASRHAGRFNLKSPPTSKVDYEAAASARIIQSMQASMDMGCEMAVAFAKAVSAASSPRIAVLSPAEAAARAAAARAPPHAVEPRSSGRKPEKKESDASEGERRWHVELGSPRLFADDRRWLFYPPTMRERPEHTTRTATVRARAKRERERERERAMHARTPPTSLTLLLLCCVLCVVCVAVLTSFRAPRAIGRWTPCPPHTLPLWPIATSMLRRMRRSRLLLL